MTFQIRRLLPMLLFLAVLVDGRLVDAADMPKPSGPVLLVVDGNISKTNAKGEARFDRAMLEEIGVETLVTSTPFTDGTISFTGISIRNLLAAVGASGRAVTAHALNDYSADIPMSDFEQYDILLAMVADGKTLTRRDKGPLWVIFPWDQNPELKDGRRDSASVWQVNRLTIR